MSYVEYIGGIGVNISLRKPMDTAERHRLDEMGDLRRQGFTLAAIGARFERNSAVHSLDSGRYLMANLLLHVLRLLRERW